MTSSDIQCAEAEVFENAASEVDAKVQRVHIGMHGPEIEHRLRHVFESFQWEQARV
jgi:hypothetical protein